MGQGHTGADDKVSSALHMFSLQVFDVEHLLRFLDEFQSFTSDLGTEVKITDFFVDRARLGLIMPTWLSSRISLPPPRPELLDDADHAAPVYHNPLLQCDGSAFLRNALLVPGAGHMIHNVVKGLPDAMPHYTTFLDELAVIEQLLTHSGRRERMVAKCVLGTPFETHKHVLLNFSFTLYKERWGAVAAFCVAALKAVALLRRCWVERTYTEDGGDQMERQWGEFSKKFEPSAVTAVLKSPLFRHFHYMMVKLKYVPSRLMGWFDSCPCHDHLLALCTTHSERQAALRNDGIASGYCVCGSCRMWELIDGKLESVLLSLSEAIESDITEVLEMKNHDGLTTPLTASDYACILGNFRGGIGHFQLGFGIRNAWTKNLPWMLMAVPHPEPRRGAFWAAKCIEAFGQKPEKEHHRKSLLFLKPGSPLRAAMDIFVETHNMPDLLRLNTAPFLLVPLGDRYIEREHKYLSDIARPKTGVSAGHTYSIRRLRYVERVMNQNTEFTDNFIKHFLNVKTIKGAIAAFGLENHPLFTGILRTDYSWGKVVPPRVWALFEQIIYRQELSVKHESFPAANKLADRDDERRKMIAHRRPARSEIPTSVERVLLMNASEHLKTRGSDFGMLTMLRRRDSDIRLEAQSLEELLHREERIAEEVAGDDQSDGELDALDQSHRRLEQAAAELQMAEREQNARDDAQDNLVEGRHPARYCFRILKASPGRIKTVATYVPEGGAVLNERDVEEHSHFQEVVARAGGPA